MRLAACTILVVAALALVLAGPAAAQQTSTTTDLLPGVALVTEEVAPGVLRVVSDGVRDLSRQVEDTRAEPGVELAIGRDGSAWIFWPERFYRLGDEETYEWDGEPVVASRGRIEVSPAGAPWTIIDGDLRSFAGDAWTTERGSVSSFDMWPDGTVFSHDDRSGFARLGEGGWTSGGGEEGPFAFWVSPVVHEALLRTAGDESTDGGRTTPDVKAAILVQPEEVEAEGLSWTLLAGTEEATRELDDQLVEQSGVVIGAVDMDDHGDVWLCGSPHTRELGTVYLLHLTAGQVAEGSVYHAADGVPTVVSREDVLGWGLLRAAPDGSVWLTPRGTDPCGGVATFDGETWNRYLDGLCVYAMEVAPDGTTWLQAGEWGSFPTAAGRGPVETYVIRPEATSAVE